MPQSPHRRRIHAACGYLLVLALTVLLGSRIAIATTAPPTGTAAQTSIQGPLRAHPTNPRYSTDDSGQAIYLTGSNTWNNLQDIWDTDPPTADGPGSRLAFNQRTHCPSIQSSA